MTLELLLMHDEKVLLRVPIGRESGVFQPLDERELGRLSDLLAIGANRKRLKIMVEFARGRELRFSDVMMIATNPKLAQDCLQPLLREGLLLHEGRGSTYRASPRGLALALAMTVGAGPVLEALEEELEREH
jgi:predicted transcriptional regulator